MSLASEQLTEIEEFAALHFTKAEISIIMEFANDEIENTHVKEAMNRGRLKSEAEVWQSIFRLAKQGSSPAQTLAIQRINKLKAKDYE